MTKTKNQNQSMRKLTDQEIGDVIANLSIESPRGAISEFLRRIGEDTLTLAGVIAESSDLMHYVHLPIRDIRAIAEAIERASLTKDVEIKEVEETPQTPQTSYVERYHGIRTKIADAQEELTALYGELEKLSKAHTKEAYSMADPKALMDNIEASCHIINDLWKI